MEFVYLCLVFRLLVFKLFWGLIKRIRLAFPMSVLLLFLFPILVLTGQLGSVHRSSCLQVMAHR